LGKSVLYQFKRSESKDRITKQSTRCYLHSAFAVWSVIGFVSQSFARVIAALHELKIAVFWLSSAIEPLVF
ncbi:hypothetical protein L4C31_19350, partial [Aliivibrio sifiae]